jgi:flagellar basal-body rod protein FlgC
MLTLTLCASLVTIVNALDCSDLQKAQLRLQVHASNLANLSTTRDQSGSPYQRRRVECAGETCSVVSENTTKMKYDPSHADADANGYVRLPDIDPIREKAALTAAAQELRLLAHASVCNEVKVSQEDQETISISYKSKDSPISAEKLKFSDKKEISVWSRTYRSGKEESVTF